MPTQEFLKNYTVIVTERSIEEKHMLVTVFLGYQFSTALSIMYDYSSRQCCESKSSYRKYMLIGNKKEYLLIYDFRCLSMKENIKS